MTDPEMQLEPEEINHTGTLNLTLLLEMSFLTLI